MCNVNAVPDELSRCVNINAVPDELSRCVVLTLFLMSYHGV